MTTNAWMQLAVFLGVLVALAKPLGSYMARVFEGRPCGLDRVLGGFERFLYRLAGIDPAAEMTWKGYAASLLAFNALGLLAVYPALGALNVMRLATPTSAVLSAVIFNALVIIFLIPLALRGVRYRAVGAARLLRDNLLLFGVGGLIVPFIGIKLIDLVLVGFGLTG